MTWVPGEELLGKVWASIDKLGTGILSPWQIRREGRAKADVRRHEQILEERTKADLEEFRAGRLLISSDGKISLPNSTPSGRERVEPPLLITKYIAADLPRVSIEAHAPEHSIVDLHAANASRRIAQDLQQLINLRQVVREVESEVEMQPQPAGNGPMITDDWLTQWREGAERTTSSEMQKLWAKLLIEETKNSGSFSLRTISILKTLDASDAQLISKLAPYVLNRSIILKGALDSIAASPTFMEILESENIGFLAGSGVVGQSWELKLKNDETSALTCHQNLGILIKSAEPKEHAFPALVLTRVGRELVGLGSFLTPPDYLVRCRNQLREAGFTANIVTILSNTDGMIFSAPSPIDNQS